jgi:hypothetical protein
MKVDKKQNFISIDKKTARNSYGDFFTIGQIVEHEGADDTATIISFEIDKKGNEIKVITDKGYAHIDFIFHPIKKTKKKDIVWIKYDENHVMNKYNGMIVKNDCDLNNIQTEDIKGFDKL